MKKSTFKVICGVCVVTFSMFALDNCQSKFIVLGRYSSYRADTFEIEKGGVFFGARIVWGTETPPIYHFVTALELESESEKRILIGESSIWRWKRIGSHCPGASIEGDFNLFLSECIFQGAVDLEELRKVVTAWRDHDYDRAQQLISDFMEDHS